MTIHSNFFFNEEEFILLLYSKFLSTYIVLVLKIPENRILVPNLVWGGGVSLILIVYLLVFIFTLV